MPSFSTQDAPQLPVLLVGAGPEVLRALSATAAELGMRMADRDTEAAALDYAGTHGVALAIVDLAHSTIDAAAFGKRLRALQTTAAALVFLVDAGTPRAQIDAAAALGKSDFLALPLIDGLARARLLHSRTASCGAGVYQPLIHELKASEERVRLATDAAELGMWRWQPEDDQMVWENTRMCDIFRVPHDAAPFSSAHFSTHYLHPDDSADFNEAVAHTLSTGARFHFEGRYMPGDGGACRWIEFTGLLQPQAEGTRPQMIGTANDITARKRTEEDLRALAAELSESNRKKGVFLATLAHELRNPLAPIRTGLAVLGLGGDKPEAVARIRAMMERQVSHMVHLVDDLLDVARISSGKVDLKIARVDVKAVVASAVETSQPLIDAARHTLSVELSPVPLWLDADLNRLAQVVSNLLTNAAKYTLPGGTIHLRVSRDERYVLIAVTDSGMGIPRAELPTVFDMFTQVSTHAPQAQGGLGIGLSLVRHLAELHGGSVAVHSEGEGMGSTFEVRLPLADTGERRKYTRPSNAPDPMAHAGLTVLIADDNEDAAEALSEFLRIAGHHVTTVNNGHDALRTAVALAPDAILLDIGMPGLNGYEVARALRAMAEMEKTVLVALTGWGTDDDRSRASAAGFDHHLTKPTSAADIVKVLGTARPRGA